MTLHGDFETRSPVDLKAAGIDVYAKDPLTDALCLAFAFGDEEPAIWTAEDTSAPLVPVADHIAKGGEFVAHNAPFEFNIWNHVLRRKYPRLPVLEIKQMRCTMAEALAMSLPAGLDDLAAALGVDMKKDAEGGRIMRFLCAPIAKTPFDHPVFATPETHRTHFDKLYVYCKQDVRVERAAEKRMLRLSAKERELWNLDQIINMRGVAFDRPLAERFIRLAEIEKQKADAKIISLTGKAVNGVNDVAGMVLWLQMHGAQIDGLGKQKVADCLKADLEAMLEDEERDGRLPDFVRDVLLIRQAAAKSSISKFRAMLACASPDDGRMRHLFQYHGAGPGRWTGRRVQLQNLPRPSKDMEEFDTVNEMLTGLSKITQDEAALQYIETFYGPPLERISDSIRCVLQAKPGCMLIAPDFSNVEGRGVAWLSGEDWKIKAFIAQDNGTGPGIYELSYSTAHGVPVKEVTKSLRQIGKVQELALGYQGGVGAFQNMAKVYGVKLPDAEAERIKTLWRDAHPATVQAWKDLEDAAFAAVSEPGTIHYATPKRIAFTVAGSFLWLRLPSGRKLCYPFPKIRMVDMPWKDEETGEPAKKLAVTYMGIDSKTKKWSIQKAYGGFWMQNVIEGVCRDLLVNAMFAAELADFDIIMHVHDEIVTEVPEEDAVQRTEELANLVVQLPPWAEGFPLAVSVDGWPTRRYHK